MTIQELVEVTRKENKLSFRRFAAGMNEYLVDPREHYSHSAPYLWARGDEIPRYSPLEGIAKRAPADSWQYKFAAAGMEIVLGVVNA